MGPGLRVGAAFDDHLVIAHVVQKAVEDQRLVEHGLERCLHLTDIHTATPAGAGRHTEKGPLADPRGTKSSSGQTPSPATGSRLS